MSDKNHLSTYHVLLIGIDRYPPGYNSLEGCVNDIDAIENLLFEQPSIGIPPDQIQITRLAAPHPNYKSTSRFVEQTKWPTRENVITALQDMTGSAVNGSDRVLIFYAGHGDERQWIGSSVWHETLVPHDGEKIEDLFDVEINMLVGAIAAKTSDLTIILNCCHSAGATRDLSGINPTGNLRFLQHQIGPVPPPDLTKFGASPGTGTARAITTGMLHAPAPNYLVVVACQADEKAGEGAYPVAQSTHGVFTYSLLNTLKDMDADQRAQLRWADIWPTMLATVAARNAQLRQRAQHPWIIGRSERKIFGGHWEKMDAGYRVTKRTDSNCTIGAGTLMGITEDAEIAVYGLEPRFFPPLGTPEDQPVARLKVIKAERADAVAVAIDATFTLPEGARGRLVKPGKSERLRVSLKPEGTPVPELLAKSPLLEIVPSTAPDADVEVLSQPDRSWIIGSDVEPIMAVVPAGESKALRASIEHYYRYSAVLRFAKNCNDPYVSKCLDVRILDCNDMVKLQAMSPEQLADPDLPEAPRDNEGHYNLSSDFRFCFRVTNSSSHHLYVTLFNASAGGLVEYLSDTMLRDGASHVMWLDGNLGEVFVTGLDTLPAAIPGIGRPDYAAERVIAIGTTRPGVDLRYLTVDKRVQVVVDENLLTRKGGERPLRPTKEIDAPAELWTAAVIPVHLPRQ